MKKRFFIFAMTVAIASLAACSSEQKPTDPDALPDGIMQPVENTGAVGGGSFMPEIEQSSMPANMK